MKRRDRTSGVDIVIEGSGEYLAPAICGVDGKFHRPDEHGCWTTSPNGSSLNTSSFDSPLSFSTVHIQRRIGTKPCANCFGIGHDDVDEYAATFNVLEEFDPVALAEQTARIRAEFADRKDLP